MEKRYSRVKVNVPELRAQRQAEGDGLPELEGYAAVFNQRTDLWWFTEEIAPGAFADSLERKDDVRALFNHDPNLVLGRSTSGTLELSEDDHGLKVRIFPPDTPTGREVSTLIERGDISQMSFGFYIDEEQRQAGKNGEPDHYVIRRATLFDVSPVTFPAYESTEIDLKRAAEKRAADYSRRSRSLAEAALNLRERVLRLLRI